MPRKLLLLLLASSPASHESTTFQAHASNRNDCGVVNGVLKTLFALCNTLECTHAAMKVIKSNR